MLHIFYTHSNITNIVIAERVKQLLENGEEVLVLTGRNQKWFYNDKRVQQMDITFHHNYFEGSLKTYYTLQRIKLRKMGKKLLDKCIPNKTYYAYIPQMHIPIAHILIKNVYCKGYYYIEEGTLAYVKLDYIHSFKRFKKIKDKVAAIITHYFIEDTRSLKICDKFKGTIALSDDAFLWNKKYEKIKSRFETYFENANIKQKTYKTIAVLGFLDQQIDTIKKMLEYLCMESRVVESGELAIKFHPQAYTSHIDNLEDVTFFLKSINNIKIEILSPDFVVEKNIAETDLCIYSVYEASSLIIYNIIKGNTYSYYLTMKDDEDEFCLIRYDNVNDYLAMYNN